MLKIKGIRDDGRERRLFEISDEGSPASDTSVEIVARFASHLLRENGLAGEFRRGGSSLLELRLPAEKRTFFHDGIVFAALDAVNDPVKNPTLTRFSLDPPDTDS
jgi:hypothetical protein